MWRTNNIGVILYAVPKERRGVCREAIESLLKSGYLSQVSSDEVDIRAGRYKCSRAISLVDCYVLALAKVQKIPAIFAKQEEDLRKEIGRRPFDAKLLFLEDFVSRGRQVMRYYESIMNVLYPFLFLLVSKFHVE